MKHKFDRCVETFTLFGGGCRRGICQMFYTSKIPILFDFIREKRIYRDVLGKK